MNPHKKCILCGEYTREGINIFGRFICGNCEITLVNTDVCDDRYDDYKELLKKGMIQNRKTEYV